MRNKLHSLTCSLLGAPLTLVRPLTKAPYFLFIALLLAGLARMPSSPLAHAATAVDDTATTTPNTPVMINVLANDIDDLDVVFANYFSERNRDCLGDGTGGFIGCADVSMNTQQTNNVSLGDVNGDSNLDAVFGNLGSVHRVCLGNGAGGFTTCSQVSLDTSDNNDGALGAVNSDGNLDAVFANQNQRNRVCLGNGDGTFGTFPPGTCGDVSTDTNYSLGVALGLVDSGGNLDAVFANGGVAGQANRVCLGDGSGGFACTDVSADTNRSADVALGHLDGGGNLDAVFANYASQVNRRCLGNGAGGFACADVSADTNDTQGVALGDLNDDGDLDAVFANWNQANRRCLGNGAGGFTCANVSADTNATRGVALGDLNHDSNLDAVFANRSQRDRVCLGNGAGGFTCTDVSTDTNASEDVALGLLGLDVSTVAVTVAPVSGAAVVNADGTITYTPNPGFFGVDTFTYSVEGSTATVTVDVAQPPWPGVIPEASTLLLLGSGLAGLRAYARLRRRARKTK